MIRYMDMVMPGMTSHGYEAQVAPPRTTCKYQCGAFRYLASRI